MVTVTNGQDSARYYEDKANAALYDYNNYGETERYAKLGIAVYKRAGTYNMLEDKAFFYLLVSEYFENKFDEMLVGVDSACDKAQRLGHLLEQQGGMQAKCDIFYFKGNFDSSFYYLLELRRTVKGDNDPNFPFSSLTLRLARLYWGIGDYKTALDDYRQVFLRDNDASIGDRTDLGMATQVRMEFPELFALNGHMDSAWYYYDHFDTLKANQKALRIYWVSTGETYLLQGQYVRALYNFARGLDVDQRLNDLTEMKRATLGLASAYHKMGDEPQAIAYARNGLALAQETKSRQYARDAYQVLYAAYDHMGNTDSAFKYYKQYMEAKALVANDQIRGRYLAYDYDQKIKLLDTQKQLTEQRLSEASLQKLLLLIAIVLVVSGGVVVVSHITLKRKNESHQRKAAEVALHHQKIQSQELEMQVLRAQMNPHFIFNSLNSINRFILQNNRGQASEYLTKFSRLVRMILQNSQSPLISLESELEALSLYLEMEALRFNFHFIYSIVYPEELEITLIKVPPLIIQPFVENAIWHGLMQKEEPGQLLIKIEEGGGVLWITIRDDGIGRQQAALLASKSATRHKSMGLKITAERIEALGSGHASGIIIKDLVHPDGSPAGTEVLIKIPIVYESDSD